MNIKETTHRHCEVTFGYGESEEVDRWLSDNGYEVYMQLQPNDLRSVGRIIGVKWNGDAIDCGGSCQPLHTVKWAELVAERDRLREELAEVLASAVPHPKQHQRMFAAWAKARKALEESK